MILTTHSLLENICFSSQYIDTQNDGVLPYPDMYFTKEEEYADEKRSYYNCSTRKNFESDETFERTKYIESRIPGLKIPNRHKCYPKLCPIHKEYIDSVESVSANWTYHAHAICKLHEIDSILSSVTGSNVKPVVNVVIFGGSMTKAQDMQGTCCAKENLLCQPSKNDNKAYENGKFYCSWSSFYGRFLANTFKSIDFHVYNLGQNGFNSFLMGQEAGLLLQYYNITLTQNDIVFLDHSCNDLHYVTLSQLELLVRQIMHNSRGFPTIILMEQFSGGGSSSDNDTNPPSIKYKHVYREVAKYYSIPIFSFYELIWSNFAWKFHKDLVQHIAGYELHVPWHTHLFIADNLAGFTINMMKKCNDNDIIRSNFHHIPKPMTNIRTLESAVCNMSQSLLMDYVASSSQHKSGIDHSNLSMDSLLNIEKNLTKWTNYADRHGVYGWIINRNVPKTEYLLKFTLPSVIEEFKNDTSFLLTLTYLKTYTNCGRAKVSICGKLLDIPMEGCNNAVPNGYNTRKVSVPHRYSHLITAGELKSCNSRFIGVVYEGENDLNGSDIRLRSPDLKFKLFSLILCVASDQENR